jgi:hypothetical protein
MTSLRSQTARARCGHTRDQHRPHSCGARKCTSSQEHRPPVSFAWGRLAPSCKARYMPHNSMTRLFRIVATEWTRAVRYGNTCSCPLSVKRDTKGHHLCTSVSQLGADAEFHGRYEGSQREKGLHEGLEQSGESSSLVRSGLAVLTECEIVFPARFQTCRGGDMACVQDPLGHTVSPRATGRSKRRDAQAYAASCIPTAHG